MPYTTCIPLASHLLKISTKILHYIMCVLLILSQSSKAKPSAQVGGSSSPTKPVRSPTHRTADVTKRAEEEEERKSTGGV